MKIPGKITLLPLFILLFLALNASVAQVAAPAFRVIAFYTAQHDPAHVSFVHEANRWFSAAAATNGFSYDSTNNWDNRIWCWNTP
jgi:hypothetical protein